jgi:hypothetical protein
MARPPNPGNSIVHRSIRRRALALERRVSSRDRTHPKPARRIFGTAPDRPSPKNEPMPVPTIRQLDRRRLRLFDNSGSELSPNPQRKYVLAIGTARCR